MQVKEGMVVIMLPPQEKEMYKWLSNAGSAVSRLKPQSSQYKLVSKAGSEVRPSAPTSNSPKKGGSGGNELSEPHSEQSIVVKLWGRAVG